MKGNSNDNFLKHFFTVGVGTIVNVLLGILTTPLITRIANPSEYGQLNIFNAYADISLAILFIGLDRGLVRFFYNKEDNKNQRSLLKLCFMVPIIAGLIVSFLFISLTKLGIIRTQFQDYVMILLCTYVLVCIWNRLSILLLRLTYQTKKYTIITIIQKLVYCFIIIGFVLVIKKYYLLMLILSTLVSTLVGGIVATIYTKEYWIFDDVKTPDNSKEILKYSYPFIAYSCMDALLQSMDKLCINNYLTDYETGIYSSALALVAIFLMIKTIFDTIWVPMQTEHFVKNPEDKTFIQKGNRYITILLLFMCINAIMFKDILCYILGSAYRSSAQIIPFLLFGSTLYAISDTTISGIEYSKKSYLHAIISAVALAVNFVGNNTLVPLMGPKGAAIATCSSFVVYLVMRIHYSNKYYYIDYGAKKLLVISVPLVIFSYLNTYYVFGLEIIVTYIICMLIFVLIYRKDMVDMFIYFKDSLLPKKS